jgi:hypothetical protein
VSFVDEAAEGVVTEGAPAAEVTEAEPFGAESLGEPTVGETGEAAVEAPEEPELYVVKVGGREEQVSLEDLTNGYMRQADYTRKTQELAQQREQVAQMHALQTALERDPRATLAALAGVFGVDFGAAAQGAAANQLSVETDPLEILAKQVETLTGTLTAQQQAALQAQQQAQQQAAIQAQVDREIADLKGAHGEFDHMELVRYAVENQAPNLAVAYRAWQFDQAEAARIAERNRVVAEKRRAQVVSGGQATGGAGAVAPGNGGGRMTAREAILAALAGQPS